MVYPFNLSLIAVLLFAFGIPLMVEGVAIRRQGKKIVPIPKRILNRLILLTVGREKGERLLVDRTTPAQLRTYAAFALIEGTAFAFLGLLYLYWALSLLTA